MRLYDYPASPNCYKVRLTLAELGIEYERVNVDIFGGDTLTEEYGEVNPARATPALELDDGTHLVESNAIVLHLSEGTELLPADAVERAQVYAWMFFEQARIVPFVGGARFSLKRGDEEQAERQRQLGTGIIGLVAHHLDGREYVVGDRFSVADICLYGYLHAADQAGIDTSVFPALAAWLERVRSRPRHMADLEPIPDSARRGQTQSLYDLIGM